MTPSKRLQYIIDLHKLTPVIFIEYTSTASNKGIKTSLNRNAGVYMCVNLINGNLYVGSASKGYLYDRYRAHIHKAKKQGSKIVNYAVDRYGIDNFAFVVLEHVHNEKSIILEKEQYYIDILIPIYNIAKIAGSVIGVTRSIEQRIKQSLYMKSDASRYEHLINIARNKSDTTKMLLSISATGRVISEETRNKISVNNVKSTSVVVKQNENVVFTFNSIADCAEHFYQDRMKRGPIRWSIKTGKLLFNKYTIIQESK